MPVYTQFYKSVSRKPTSVRTAYSINVPWFTFAANCK